MKAFVPLGQSRDERKVSGAVREAFNRSRPRDLQGAPLSSSPIPDSPSKRSKAALACQSRMSVDYEAIQKAKGKAELRRKVEEFVEMLRSEDMSLKVTSAAVTPPKESISGTKDARKGPLVKPKDFDGTTPVEAFLQQINTCAKYYCWSEEECSIHLCCATIGDAAALVWSQLDPDGLSYQQLQTLLRERYGSEKQEEKYQAELRRKILKRSEKSSPHYGRI